MSGVISGCAWKVLSEFFGFELRWLLFCASKQLALAEMQPGLLHNIQ